MNKKLLNILNDVETEHNEGIERTRNSRVLIVDGLNTFIRCWSSIPTMNDDGEHVAGVTCPLRSIGYAIKQVNPTRVIIAFDGKGGSKSRKKIFGGYKSKRKEKKIRVNRQYDEMMTDEDEHESMKRQYVWLFEMLHHLPVTTMMYDGIEADDVMAYITTHLLGEEEQAVLMSTDKDFLQLINHKTLVWSPTKKKLYNEEIFKEEWGLPAKNLLLFRMADGDNSDEIPGVKGIGLKTMISRIPEITEDKQLSLDDFLQLVEEKKKEKNYKIYDAILDSVDQLKMNHRLMQLDNVVIPADTKLKIMDRFDEETNPLNKRDFLKACIKYKIINNLGNIDDWLRLTFGSLITK